MLYKRINNNGLGECDILKINSYGYLIYSEHNTEHFIIVKEIIDNNFYYNEYFISLDKALSYFNSLVKIKEENDERL